MIVNCAIRYKGKIYTGKNHGDILSHMIVKGILQRGEYDDGFTDEYGDFLNRKQAAKEAFKCKQIPARKEKLFSTDMGWK